MTERPPPLGEDVTARSTRVAVGRISPGDRRWRGIEWLVPALLFLLGIWITRSAWGGYGPAGDDLPYHLGRAKIGWDSIFRSGHLDGWAPIYGAGSQAYLLYGPGLPLVFALLKAVTFGQAGDGLVMSAIATGAYAAVAPAMVFVARSLRMSRLAAGFVGLAALCVSVPFGVGIAGTFDLGLIANQLAAPLMCLALGLMVRVLLSGGTHAPPRTIIALATTMVALLVTHPATMVMFGLVAPLLALFVIAHEAGSWQRAADLAVAGAIACGLGAWWLLPLAENHEPRAPSADWSTPPIGERLVQIVTGDKIFVPVLAALSVLAIGVLAAQLLDRRAAVWRQASGAGLVLLAPLTLGIGYWLRGRYGAQVDAANLVPNRGLGYVGLLMTLPLGEFLARSVPVVVRRRYRAQILWAVAAVVLAYSPGLIHATETIGHVERLPARVTDTAAELRHEMSPWSRFVFAQEDSFRTSFGIVHPELWIALEADRNIVTDFGGNSVSGFNNYIQDHIFDGDPASTDATLAAAGVTHMVLGADDQLRMVDRPGWVETWAGDGVWIYARRSALETAPDALIVAGRDDDIRLEHASDERIAWRKRSPAATTAVMAVAYFPKWHVRFGGRELSASASADGLLEVALPSGTGRLTATFERDGMDHLSLAISLLTVAGLGLALIGPDRLRRLSRRSSQS